MSWIQNFFERFKKEEEAIQHEIHTNNHRVNDRKPLYNKDLDARIAYQYPKGHFRFPIIPDDKKPIHHEKEHVEKKKQTVEWSHSQQEHKPKRQKDTVKLKKGTTTNYRSSGPFRPTEIPSPIFGFNRPQKAVVEFELSKFEDKKDTHALFQSIDVFEAKETVETKKIESSIEDPVEDDFGTIEMVEAEKVEAYDDEDSVEDGAEAASQVEATLEESESDHFMTEYYPEEVNEAAAAVAEVAASAEIMEASPNYFEALDNDHEISVTEEAGPIAGIKDESHAELEKPKRTHLPFNVMMLKQDKQKWETKKRQETEEQPKLHEHFQTENVIISDSEESKAEMGAKQGTANYEFPAFQLLNPPIVEDMDSEWLQEQEQLLNQTLENFNVGAKVVNITQGPAVTRFEVQPLPGVKVNKVTNLSDDIKLSLAARDIRIEAPIPGKHTIGIEVPNQKSRPVRISEIIQSHVFRESSSPLTAVLGLDISGKPIVTDLKKMPHGLIAGATGSGKSVCINSILVSLLYKANPEDLKLLLIDPKMVELAPYNRIPHLVSPVITDVKAATAALKWAVEEMERRYELFAHTGVRDINRFNELATGHKRYSDKLPFIVIVIDELADLMMMSPADVEEAICRIAQKARACGIHLIIATQRPSVDVITGLIKANIPTRIAFSVSSQVDSRTIIDMSGAEKLLGRGDMLFLENGSSKPVRLQGTFVSDEEIDLACAHVREQQEPDYLFVQEELLKKAQMLEEEDELFYEACEFAVDQSSASTSSLQRRFKIGYNRAARLMEMMEKQGYISSAKGSKPRDVLITVADLESIGGAGNRNDSFHDGIVL